MWTKPPEAPPSLSRGEEMKVKDQQSKDKMKIYADYRKHAKPPNLVPNDQLLVHKERSHQLKTEAYYEPLAYTVIDKKGSMLTARNGKHSTTRNSSMFKPFRSVTESVKIESDEGSADNGIVVRSPDKYSAPVNKRKLLKKGDTLLELQRKTIDCFVLERKETLLWSVCCSCSYLKMGRDVALSHAVMHVGIGVHVRMLSEAE